MSASLNCTYQTHAKCVCVWDIIKWSDYFKLTELPRVLKAESSIEKILKVFLEGLD